MKIPVTNWASTKNPLVGLILSLNNTLTHDNLYCSCAETSDVATEMISIPHDMSDTELGWNPSSTGFYLHGLKQDVNAIFKAKEHMGL